MSSGAGPRWDGLSCDHSTRSSQVLLFNSVYVLRDAIDCLHLVHPRVAKATDDIGGAEDERQSRDQEEAVCDGHSGMCPPIPLGMYPFQSTLIYLPS